MAAAGQRWDDDDSLRLLFGIRRSVRYHDRRLAHYQSLQKVTNFLTVMLSGVVLFDIAGSSIPGFVKWISLPAAVLSALDLVVGYGHLGSLHRDLKHKFTNLERRMIVRASNDSTANVQADRIVTEADEPPPFRALDGLCHNELLIADGASPRDPQYASDFKSIPWHMRVTANWIRWPDVGMRTETAKGE